MPTCDINFSVTAVQTTLQSADSGFTQPALIPSGATQFTPNLSSYSTGQGTSITVSWWQFDNSGAISLAAGRLVHSGDPTPASYTAIQVHSGATQVQFRVNTTYNQPNNAISAAGFLRFDAACDANYCAYGSGPKIVVVGGVVAVSYLAEAIAAALGQPEALLISALGSLTLISTEVLCTSLPPSCQTIQASDWTTINDIGISIAYQKLKDCFLNAAWGLLCECNSAPSGQPSPVEPPVVTVPSPPTLPPPGGSGGGINLPVTCDGTDVCSQLAVMSWDIANLRRLVEQVNAQTQYLLLAVGHSVNELQTAEGQLMNLVTLIQRQHVPFAYIHGVQHSSLTGHGQLNVQGILGLSVTSTTIPGRLSATMAPINSYFRLGEISLGTADGWIRRQVITHNPHLILDVPPDVTLVAYLFEDGVVATILELIREF